MHSEVYGHPRVHFLVTPHWTLPRRWPPLRAGLLAVGCLHPAECGAASSLAWTAVPASSCAGPSGSPLSGVPPPAAGLRPVGTRAAGVGNRRYFSLRLCIGGPSVQPSAELTAARVPTGLAGANPSGPGGSAPRSSTGAGARLITLGRDLDGGAPNLRSPVLGHWVAFGAPR